MDMRTGDPRARSVAPWCLLVLLVAFLAGPAERLGTGPDRLDGVAVAAARTVVLPAVARSAPHLACAKPVAPEPLLAGTLAAALMLLVGAAWLARKQAALPVHGRLLTALRRGRSPPRAARSAAPADW